MLEIRYARSGSFLALATNVQPTSRSEIPSCHCTYPCQTAQLSKQHHARCYFSPDDERRCPLLVSLSLCHCVSPNRPVLPVHPLIVATCQPAAAIRLQLTATASLCCWWSTHSCLQLSSKGSCILRQSLQLLCWLCHGASTCTTAAQPPPAAAESAAAQTSSYKLLVGTSASLI